VRQLSALEYARKYCPHMLKHFVSALRNQQQLALLAGFHERTGIKSALHPLSKRPLFGADVWKKMIVSFSGMTVPRMTKPDTTASRITALMAGTHPRTGANSFLKDVAKSPLFDRSIIKNKILPLAGLYTPSAKQDPLDLENADDKKEVSSQRQQAVNTIAPAAGMLFLSPPVTLATQRNREAEAARRDAESLDPSESTSTALVFES